MEEAPPPHSTPSGDGPDDRAAARRDPSGSGVVGDQGLCARFLDALGVHGASITVFGLGGQHSTVCASDATAARADALQLELGEGPHWQALLTRAPTLCADLDGDEHVAWPLFTQAARRLGIAAVYAFPITLGAVTVGAVDLHSRHPRRLDAREVALARALTGSVATAAVRSATASANDPHSVEHAAAPALRREVHQATGMIQAQLDCSATEAFARLRAHAFATDTPIDEIARLIVDRTLDFSTIDD